jgi:single-strand DNA-binding protein
MIANGLARIGRDVELRYLANGNAVANISLAFTYGRKSEDGKRPTQWVEAALFGKRAEALAQYLVKGGLVSVTLEDVRIETYQGANGQGHKLVGSVMALDLVPSGKQDNQQSAPAPRAAPAARPTPKASAGSGFDDFPDSDVPF